MGSFNPSKKLIYDGIRKVWVKATPEEVVRQRWLMRMVKQLDFPHELIAIEKTMKELPGMRSKAVPDRRVDILCYGKGDSSTDVLFPLLLIECKAGNLPEEAVDQVIGYNYHVGAGFVAAVNLHEVRLGAFDSVSNNYAFCSFLPSFRELMRGLKRCLHEHGSVHSFQGPIHDL